MTTEPATPNEPHAGEPPILYGYWRSSASYRVRMALNLKGIAYEQRYVHLVRDGGQQYSEDYVRLNPQAQVPTLIHEGRTLTQSLAILEYLEERFPETTPLLPGDPVGRARVRALCGVIACDIHPLNNLRVLKYLTGTVGVGEQSRLEWYRHWVAVGMDALEKMLAGDGTTGTYCHGDSVSLADCCLMPQLYNARRFGCDESRWPTITRIGAELAALPAVERALPENQADADGNL